MSRSKHSTRCRLLLTAFLTLTATVVGQADDQRSLSEPPGYSDWLSEDGWSVATVRGQGITPTSRQLAASDWQSKTAYIPDPLYDIVPGSGAGREAGGGGMGQGVSPPPVPPSPPADTMGANDATTTPTPEIGRAIQQSNRVKTTEFQQRSQLSLEPNIRGYQGGDVYTASDGLYWAPIRSDLDSMLNRLDPSLYEDITVIPGPYGLRYGPGFSFVNVTNVDTPRNPNGYESHFRTGLSTRTNGGQVYGRETAYGGGCDWGYIINYGNRVGGDYRPGGNSQQGPVPGSYKSESLLGQVGFDVNPDSDLEFRFRRLDDSDVQYPLQFFDVDYMGVDAYSLNYEQEDPSGWGSFSAMTWYSRSRFHGDTLPPEPNSEYYSINRVNAALNQRLGTTNADLVGSTNGSITITGARVAKSYGDIESAKLSVGADFRHISQGINENFEIRNMPSPPNAGPVIPFYSDLPPATMENPGAFTELTVKWLPYVSTTLGSRVDLVHTDATGDLRGNTMLDKTAFDQNDLLFALYLANEVEMNENWTARLAGGYAQRPPTLMERYADGVFLAVAQNGLTRVVGDPNLDKESGFQVDLSLEGQFERAGGRVTTFCSWVDDPITYSGFPVTDPTGAYLVKYVNGDLFIRTGIEMLGTWDLNDRWTLFGTTRYLWGEDANIPTPAGSVDQPMTGIFPLSGDVGIRWQDAEGGRVWGLEFAVRMVAAQNRTGALRVGWDEPTYRLDPNWEQSTSGFTTSRIRGYYNLAENFYVVGGVENLFDRTYLEHLNQRLPADTIGTTNFREVALLSPGITPFIGCEWTF